MVFPLVFLHQLFANVTVLVHLLSSSFHTFHMCPAYSQCLSSSTFIMSSNFICFIVHCQFFLSITVIPNTNLSILLWTVMNFLSRGLVSDQVGMLGRKHWLKTFHMRHKGRDSYLVFLFCYLFLINLFLFDSSITCCSMWLVNTNTNF